MRLSVLAFIIVLPAVAYAAVCAEQVSIDSEAKCVERGQWCNSKIPCCGRLECKWNGFSRVSLRIHLLRLTLNIETNTGM